VRLRCQVDAEEVEQIGHGGNEEGFDPFVELGEFAIEGLDAMRQRGEEALVAAVTGSGERVGRSLVPSVTRAETERPLRRQRSCSGAL
jgi:hypothetical protein